MKSNAIPLVVLLAWLLLGAVALLGCATMHDAAPVGATAPVKPSALPLAIVGCIGACLAAAPPCGLAIDSASHTTDPDHVLAAVQACGGFAGGCAATCTTLIRAAQQ